MAKSEKSDTAWPTLEFEYFGVKWEVEFVDNILDGETSPRGVVDGSIDYAQNRITVSRCNLSGVEYSVRHVRQVLLHELMHMMVAEGQYQNEFHNEAFVEWMSRAIDELIGTEAFRKIMELK